jgi:hypothetical protein
MFSVLTAGLSSAVPQSQCIHYTLSCLVAGTCGDGEGLSGSINAGNFLTSCKVHWLASQEGLCSVE